MPDLDDLLRGALRDDDWEPATEEARHHVRRRHRRGIVARRYLAASAVAASAAAVLSLAPGDGSATRGADPAAPTTAPRVVPSPAATALQGRWRSTSLGVEDVRAAARAAGAPAAAATMVAALPDSGFRVVLRVRGADLTTYVESPDGELEVLDRESIAVDGELVSLRPFAVSAESVHAWAVVGDRLTLDFRSTTEGTDGGVPGEAWQRLLYDSAPFRR